MTADRNHKFQTTLTENKSGAETSKEKETLLHNYPLWVIGQSGSVQ
jgi:hypothetical protein